VARGPVAARVSLGPRPWLPLEKDLRGYEAEAGSVDIAINRPKSEQASGRRSGRPVEHNRSCRRGETMPRLRRRLKGAGTGLVLLALLALSIGIGAAADDQPAAPRGAPGRSDIWGSWPVVPWDDRPVTASGWVDALNRPLDLTRKGKAGERREYQIKRVNLTLDRTGRVIGRMVAEARLSRTLIREEEPGVWAESCVWERFAVGQAMGPDGYPEPTEVAAARGISYEFSPRTFDYVNPPANFSRVGDEMTGYLLKVLTMDAMGWDAVLLQLRDQRGAAAHIGDTWREVHWEPWDITRVGAEGSAGQYRVGEMQVSLLGLTRFRGEPCALIWVSMEGNKVTQNLDTPQIQMRMDSTEYFRGEIAASLLDGHLVGMELWGPLPCVVEMGFGGQPPTEQPIGAMLQQVSIWEVPAG